jgi:transposase
MAEVTRDTIGCDVSDKTCELFIHRADGSTETAKLKTTVADFTEYFSGRSPAHVVVENGTHSRWISALLKKLSHEVTVANTRRVQLISESDSKSDRTDAEFLARLGRADVKLLAPIRHRGDGAQADLAVAKTRDMLVRCRVKLINQARGLVKSFGLRLPDAEGYAFHRKVAADVPEVLRPALEPLLKALEGIGEQIKLLDKKVDEIAKRYPDVEVIGQIDGIGTLTALVFLLTLEDKKRFESSRMVGAFLGLRPRRDQSGKSDKQLPITKAGDSFARKLLVLAANYIMGPFGKDCDLKRWAMKLAERGGKNARQRAKVALARKLAVLMHRLWVTGEVYQPIGYHQPKVKQLKGKKEAKTEKQQVA